MRPAQISFVFVVLLGSMVSVAGQTWTAEYTGDALPEAATPAFALSADEGATVTVDEGLLRLSTPPQGCGAVLMAIGTNRPDKWLKQESWGDAAAWDGGGPTTFEFRMRVVETFGGCKLAGQVQVSDGMHYFYLHFGPGGLCDHQGNVVYELDTTEFHTYRITLKNYRPNLYIDGTAAPVDCFHIGPHGRNAVIIGDVSSSVAGLTQWDFIRWTNQEATPWQPVEVPSMEVDKGNVWIEPRFTDISPDINYPCWGGGTPAKLKDGRILMVYSGPVGINTPLGSTRVFCRISADGGETWGPEREVVHHPECQAGGPFAFTTRDGTVRVFYIGWYKHVWREGEPDMEQTRSDVWCIESHDNGETWENRQMILRGYNGGINGAIETASGDIVLPLERLVTDPGRYVSACAVSSDGGRTWTLGEAIDLGGHGDHAGAIEPCVVELQDHRVWMLIRTTKGQFWSAFSNDNGLTWSESGPSQIRSPSAPCHITRLSSGRLVLVWNNTMDTTKGRDALSVALSEDDGKTWTEPIVCATAKQVSYPNVFEPKPGVIWVGVHNVTAGFNSLAVVTLSVNEEDLLPEQ